MLVDRPPEVVQLAIDPDEHFVQVPDVAWSLTASAQSFGELQAEFRHHPRTLSWVTHTPRSARMSSTSRRLRLNTWYSQTA
jgi:hypothetical protein